MEIIKDDDIQSEQPASKHEVISDDDIAMEHPAPSEGADSSVGALIRGGLNTATLGTSDILASGLDAVGDTAADAVKGNIPDNESTIQHLLKAYHQNKAQSEANTNAAKSAHPVLYGAGQIAGALNPAGLGAKAFGAVADAGLGAKIATGAGLGAVDAYGNASQDNSANQDIKQAATGAALGGIGTGVGETVINPLINKGASTFKEYLQNSPVAKQLAATVQNAAKGGSLFGEAGSGAVTDQSSALTKDAADALTDNVKAQTNKMANAFKQTEGSTITPATEDLSTISTAKDTLQGQTPGGFEEEFNNLQNGTMTPQEANDFRTQLKGHINDLYGAAKMQANPNLARTAKQLQDSGLIGSLESMSTDAGTDIAGLNRNISQARDPIDAFVQRAGRITDDPTQQAKWSSSVPVEKQNATIQATLDNLVKNGGKGTDLGDRARSALQDYQSLLEKAKLANPSANINPVQSATDLQNQAYLNAAKQNVNGIRDAKFGLNDIGKGVLGKAVNPYKIAEFGAKFKGVQDMSKALLSPSPLDRLSITKGLYSNPKTKALGDQYLEALDAKNEGKLNNVIFQMMQNPDAKKAMGLPGADDSPEPDQNGNGN